MKIITGSKHGAYITRISEPDRQGRIQYFVNWTDNNTVACLTCGKPRAMGCECIDRNSLRSQVMFGIPPQVQQVGVEPVQEVLAL